MFRRVLEYFWKCFSIFFENDVVTTKTTKKQKKTGRALSKIFRKRTKTVRKTETTIFEMTCIFTRFLRTYVIIKLSTPLLVDLNRQEKTRKNKVCLKWKISSWRSILSKNRQNRSYPRGVNVRSKFLVCSLFFFAGGRRVWRLMNVVWRHVRTFWSKKNAIP